MAKGKAKVVHPGYAEPCCNKDLLISLDAMGRMKSMPVDIFSTKVKLLTDYLYLKSLEERKGSFNWGKSF